MKTVSIKFYWNTDTLIHLRFVHNSFHVTVTELSCCEEMLGPTKPKIFTVVFTGRDCQPLSQMTSKQRPPGA